MARLIRSAGPDDAAAIAAIYRPYVEASRVTFEEIAPLAAQIAERMSNPLLPWLVALEDGTVAGYSSTSPMRARRAYRWSVETGIYLAPEHHGRGLGRELLGAHLALLERQGYVAAFGTIALPNEPSIGLHRALGFTHIGTEIACGFKLGQWLDVSRWQKPLAPLEAQPREPLPFAGLVSAAVSACAGGG